MKLHDICYFYFLNSATVLKETPTTSCQSSAVSNSDDPADVFLSYCHKQREDAFNVNDYLIEKQMTTWIDKEKLGGGDRMYKEMEKGVRNCKVRIYFHIRI